MERFPKAIEDLGNELIQLQLKRHLADDDPQSRFSLSDAIPAIDSAEVAIKKFRRAFVKDRRASAVWVTLQKARA